MKGRINKINIIINPPKLIRAVLSRFDSYIIKYSYLLGKKTAPFPKGIVFVINENCNAQCKMCDVGTKSNTHINRINSQSRGKFLPIEDFKKIIDSVLRHKPDIWLMATEPLLYPHFLEAAEYTVRNNLRFHFTSNGILLPKYAEDIVRIKTDRFLLSFMGSDADTHDKIMGIEGSFNKMVEGIALVNEQKKRLKQSKPSIFINFVITNDNYKQLYEHIRILSRLEVDKITISNTQFVTKDMVYAHKAVSPKDNVTESSVFSYDPTSIDTRLLEQQFRLIFSAFSRLNIALVPDIRNFNQINRYYRHPIEFLKGYEVCYYPWRFAHILANGDVVVSWRCFSKVLGNIKKKTYSQIWNDLPMREFRSKIIANNGHYPTCARCGFLWCSYNM